MKQSVIQRQTNAARGSVLALLAALMVGMLLMPVALARPLQPATAGSQPAQITQQRVFLPMVRAGGTAQPQRSTRELIDAARAAGTITLDTALLYKAQALVGDPALPATYAGAGVGDDGALLFTDVQLALPTVSATTQERLRPYFLAPSDPASWYTTHVMAGATLQGDSVATAQAATPRLTWKTTSDGPFKIWYHPEHDLARTWELYLTINREIWPKLTELFGVNSLPDCGAGCPSGGGDAAFDIYLVENASTFVMSGGLCCNQGAAFAVINRNSKPIVIAHDIALAFGMHFTGLELHNMWLLHGAVGYAMHYVYPDNNAEHRYADWYFDETNTTLRERLYDAYTYLLYQDSPVLLRTLLSRAKTMDSIANLDMALDGELDLQWQDFALASLNMYPTNYFSERDGITRAPAWDKTYDLHTPSTEPFEPVVNPLGAVYTRVIIDGSKIRKVTFNNPVPDAGVQGAHVWAWIWPATGPARVEDWGNVRTRTFCLDKPEEQIAAVALVTSFGAWQDPQAIFAPKGGTIQAEEQCGADASGTISWNFVENTQSPGFQRTVQEQASVQVRLRYDDEMGQYLDDGSTYSFGGTSSTTQIDANGVGFRGSGNSTGSGPIVAGGGGIGAYIEDGNPRHFVIGIQLPYRHQGKVTYLPSGATETSTSEGVATLTCATKPEYGDDLHGRETSEGSFDMSCTLSTGQDGVSGLTTVTGSISIRRQPNP